MDTDVTDVSEPDQEEPTVAPVPWTRRPATIVGGIAAAVVLALTGGLIWAFSGDKQAPDTALKPIAPASPASQPLDPPASDEADGLDFIGGLGESAMLDTTGSTGSTSTSTAGTDASLFSVPAGSAPSGGLPPFQLPPPPQGFQAPPPADWGALLQPYIEAQQEAVAANLAGAIAGSTVGAVSAGINSAVVIVADLILFAAYANNGGPLLNQLQAVLPAVAVPPAAASLGALDFSGLTSAFAAAAALPPIGVPTPVQLPALPPPPVGLPTPEQVMGGLAALPALGLPALPPPPPIGLPTPEQVVGGLFVLPAIGLPALPPPPSIGLPSIGLPSIGLPSITRLLGLPF